MVIDDKKIKILNSFQSLNENDKRNLFCTFFYEDDFLKIGETLYHFKKMDCKEIFYEVIGEMISNFFSLKTVKNELYKKSGEYYLLTKVFTNSLNNYSFIDGLFEDDIVYGEIYNIDNIIKYKDLNSGKYIKILKKHLEKLLIDLKKLSVVDFITGQNDRHLENFMFCYDKGYIELMPVYDYGILFEDGMHYDNLLSIYLSSEKIVEYIKNDKVFNNLFIRFLMLNIKDIFSKIENEYFIQLNNYEKDYFEAFINDKKEEVKKYNLVRS